MQYINFIFHYVIVFVSLTNCDCRVDIGYLDALGSVGLLISRSLSISIQRRDRVYGCERAVHAGPSPQVVWSCSADTSRASSAHRSGTSWGAACKDEDASF